MTGGLGHVRCHTATTELTEATPRTWFVEPAAAACAWGPSPPTNLGEVDGARLARLRWRLRGAWLWPAFLVLIVLDAFVGHELPPEGDSQSLPSAALVGAVAMLIGVVVTLEEERLLNSRYATVQSVNGTSAQRKA